jgi:uncharacterized RDD family membrane protein YckC
MTNSPDANPLPTAGLIRRLLALVYDSLLLLGVTFAYGVLIWIIRRIAGDDTLQPMGGSAALLGLLGLWLTLAGYYVLCWSKRGQTLGMKSWRLRVETFEGRHPTTAQCWQRCLLAPVSAAVGGLGYLWCWFDKAHGCWHDRWTDTRVVVLPKR